MTLAQIAAFFGYASCIIGGVAAIVSPVRKALKGMKEPINKIRDENVRQTEQLRRLAEDVARLQGDRLNEAYDKYTALGWCPRDKKRELQEWYTAYTAAGHNHLAKTYIHDLLALPEQPQN